MLKVYGGVLGVKGIWEVLGVEGIRGVLGVKGIRGSTRC